MVCLSNNWPSCLVYYLANAERRFLANDWCRTVFSLFLLLYGVLPILFALVLVYLTFLATIGKAQGQQLAIVQRPTACGSRQGAAAKCSNQVQLS